MKYLTPSHLARLANLSVDAIRYKLRRGQLVPTARTESGASLFSRLEAERWAKEYRRRTESEAQ